MYVYIYTDREKVILLSYDSPLLPVSYCLICRNNLFWF